MIEAAECQARLIHRLRAADRHGRRRILCPVVSGAKEEDDGWVRMHGKALVADDRLARVGSANLSNRSMGVATECDLAIEAENEATRAGIAAFRDGPLGEHLGAGAEAGTVLGMTPGIVPMTGLGVSAERVLRQRDAPSLLVFVAVILVLAALGYVVQRRLGVDGEHQ